MIYHDHDHDHDDHPKAADWWEGRANRRATRKSLNVTGKRRTNSKASGCSKRRNEDGEEKGINTGCSRGHSHSSPSTAEASRATTGYCARRLEGARRQRQSERRSRCCKKKATLIAMAVVLMMVMAMMMK
eukprot:6173040-Pleurochrysis_carterae.AAC.1